MRMRGNVEIKEEFASDVLIPDGRLGGGGAESGAAPPATQREWQIWNGLSGKQLKRKSSENY